MEALLNYTIIGIVTGAIYAVAASGLVVTYTTSGIFNFAHGAIGMLMAFVYWELRVNRGLPAPIALILVVLVFAPLTGAVIERVLMRKIKATDTGISLVVTLGLFLALIGVAFVIWPGTEARSIQPFFGSDKLVEIVSFRVSYHQLIMLATAAAVAVALRLLLFSSRIGVAMRAVVDDRELAGLVGARQFRVSQLSWALGSMLAAVAGILLAPQLNLEVFSLTLLVLKGYAAAVVGKLTSLPRTFAGALILGLIESYAKWQLPRDGVFNAIQPALATLLLFVVLLAIPAVRLKAGRAVGRATPPVPGMRKAAISGVVFVVAVAVLTPVLSRITDNLKADVMSNLSVGLGVSIILLSLTVLTGYGGQVSLCQLTLVGIGAYTFANVPAAGSPIALVLAMVVTSLVGVLIALPALRLQGLYLALSTLAFAALADFVFFQYRLSRSALEVPRLSLFGVSAQGETARMVLLAAAFAVMGNLVLALRRGPFGRLLSAMRDSPAACVTLGINLTVTKIALFALSGAMAAVGGALWGGNKGLVTSNDFLYLQSMVLLLIVTVAGINTVSGALIGGFLLSSSPIITPYIPERLQQITFLLTGFGALSLGREPNGIVGQVLASLPGRKQQTSPPTVAPAASAPAKEVTPVAVA